MALFDFARVKQTIQDLAGELSKLRSEREALFQKRETLEAQPACKEDLLKLLDDWIDRQGGDFWVRQAARRVKEPCTTAQRLCVTTLRQEPGAAIPHAGICAEDAG